MSIANLEKININNSTQWVLVRGKNADAPLLIHVWQGPGLPMISEANEMETQLSLERDFLVAYWDQRGCGLSYSNDIDPATISLTQMAEDVIACTRYLLNKYNQRKAIISGYSIGATVSIMAAAKDSSIFSAIIATGTDIDIPYANRYMLDFAMDNAVARGDKRLVTRVNELMQHPIVETKRFQQRAEIITNLGGVKSGTSFNSLVIGSVKKMLFSRYYRIGGLMKGVKGISFCQNALIPEMNSFNLFQRVRKISVPVHFVQGRLDAIAPPLKSKEFYEQLTSDKKSFTFFEKSAHMPQYEESAKFAKLVRSVADGSLSITASK